MTSPNRPPRSKRMMLVAGVAGTFVLGSAGVALASTSHQPASTGLSALPTAETSTSAGDTTRVEESTTSGDETSTSTDEATTTSTAEEPTTSSGDESTTTETPTTNETSTSTGQSPTLETKTYATIG